MVGGEVRELGLKLEGVGSRLGEGESGWDGGGS